jgi:hypothetical protein
VIFCVYDFNEFAALGNFGAWWELVGHGRKKAAIVCPQNLPDPKTEQKTADSGKMTGDVYRGFGCDVEMMADD